MWAIEQHNTDQIDIIESIDLAVTDLKELSPLNDGDYALCLETFEENSDQRLALLDWLEAKIISKMSRRSSSILSVGCGPGTLDEQLLRSAKTRTEHIAYLGIEPNRIEAAHFLKKMKAQKSDQVDISILIEPFGDQSFDQSFDLILFVHSLYYMDDRNKAIDLALNSLTPGGQLVICIAPDEALNAIAKLMWQRQMGQESWFSDDVRNYFEARGLEFRKTQIDAKLNVSDCFDLPTETGRKIIDFIIQTRIDKLPHSLRQMIFEFLISISETDGSKTELSHPVDIFTYKNS